MGSIGNIVKAMLHGEKMFVHVMLLVILLVFSIAFVLICWRKKQATREAEAMEWVARIEEIERSMRQYYENVQCVVHGHLLPRNASPVEIAEHAVHVRDMEARQILMQYRMFQSRVLFSQEKTSDHEYRRWAMDAWGLNENEIVPAEVLYDETGLDHVHVPPTAEIIEMFKKSSKIDRRCFACGKHLSIIEYIMVNYRVHGKSLFAIWNDERVEILCCKCYVIFDDGIENIGEMLDPARCEWK